jgi:hypothetical protein
MRMLRMEPVQKEILDKIEQTLRVEFMSNLARTSKRDAHEQMADIFNNFDRSTESRFLTALEDRSHDSAERIRALMFVFEDLNKLDPGGVQTLLRSVEKDQLALALKGSSDGLRDLFFSNMSERAAKILREDMESMGPVRLKDVDAAQSAMVQAAKEPRRPRRDHAGRPGRRRRAGVLMNPPLRKFAFDTVFDDVGGVASEAPRVKKFFTPEESSAARPPSPRRASAVCRRSSRRVALRQVAGHEHALRGWPTSPTPTSELRRAEPGLRKSIAGAALDPSPTRRRGRPRRP